MTAAPKAVPNLTGEFREGLVCGWQLHLMLPPSPLLVSTSHAISLALLFHYRIPCGKGIYREAEQLGSLVLGSLLVGDVGSLLILSDPSAFLAAHFHSPGKSSST